MDNEQPVPVSLVATWRHDEAQLYASASLDPDRYQRIVLLVARVVDRLRGLGPSSEALSTSGGSILTLVRQAAEEERLDTTSFDPILLGHAALAMRLREVVIEQSRLRRLSLISAAAARGLSWVVLEEAGEAAGDPYRPYQRLEVEVSTGRALYVTASPDDAFVGVVHEVTPVAVDLEDGRVHPAASSREDPSEHEDQSAREHRAAQLRGEPASDSGLRTDT